MLKLAQRLRFQVELAYEKAGKGENSTQLSMIQGIVGNEKRSKASVDTISEEALVLEGGGTDSTGQALEAATVFILDTPGVAAKLKEELRKAIPDENEIPPFIKLKEVKYLSAVINETLRYV